MLPPIASVLSVTAGFSVVYHTELISIKKNKVDSLRNVTWNGVNYGEQTSYKLEHALFSAEIKRTGAYSWVTAINKYLKSCLFIWLPLIL